MSAAPRRPSITPASDLEWLTAHVERHATDALRDLEGDPGYGPRVWLRYGRKKRIARALREIRDEAQLIRDTSAAP